MDLNKIIPKAGSAMPIIISGSFMELFLQAQDPQLTKATIENKRHGIFVFGCSSEQFFVFVELSDDLILF